jgi:hypothetical protein
VLPHDVVDDERYLHTSSDSWFTVFWKPNEKNPNPDQARAKIAQAIPGRKYPTERIKNNRPDQLPRATVRPSETKAMETWAISMPSLRPVLLLAAAALLVFFLSPAPTTLATTTLGFKLADGVMLAVDSKASVGSYVGSRTVRKVLPISSHVVGTMAGGAAGTVGSFVCVAVSVALPSRTDGS